MLGNLVFLVLMFVEIVFFLWSLMKNSNLKKEKSLVRIALFVVFLLVIMSPIIEWGFAWVMLGFLLGIQALWGIWVLFRRKENQAAKKSKIILAFFGRVLLVGIVILPILLFPQYEQIKSTGDYSVATKSFTLTDQSREEEFTEENGDNRKVTIQFWYPSEVKEKKRLPLVIFSHGAFGLRSSNYSTFQELASNGYIVASIDHTYHSFMTKQEDGKTIIANLDFINNAMAAQNGDMEAKKIYELEQEWMKLRTSDMAFVLDYIKGKVASDTEDEVFQMIDLEHIGAFGHSLGGATAAQIGRDDDDVDAVIVVDGTMLGDITGFEKGKYLISDVPYPKPLLNFYNESHYEEFLKDSKYVNAVAHKQGLDSYVVYMKSSGHINFTDLPIVSPILAKPLGLGDVDARECIETTNEVILQFFDKYLKSSDIKIPKERTY
jgi:dienelactone hydrolase